MAIEQIVYAEKGPCLQVSEQYILCQDRYIMEVESQNHHYRDMLFRANEAFLEEEKKEVLKKTIHVER
jgi:hypothetical protein